MSTHFDDDDLTFVAHEIVSIPSVSRNEEAAALRFIERMTERGFECHIDEAGNPVGVIGDGPQTIALVGHIDTVPGQPEVRIEDGVLHGRGSVDAKGPLVTFAAAARRAVDAGATARFVVVGCVEEEVASSKGAHHLAQTWTTPPDALIIGEPSSSTGVTLGYKGYLRAGLTITTPSAHGAHEAASAPELVSDVWTSLRDRARAFTDRDAPLFDLVMPRLLAIRSGHDGLTDEATIQLALRLPPKLSPDEAAQWLSDPELWWNAQARDDAQHTVQVNVTGGIPAWRGPRTSAPARALGRAILARGGRPRFQVKTGTADLNVLAPHWGCPAVAYGPGDAALDHTPQEHMPLAELHAGAAILADALVALAVQPGADKASSTLPNGQNKGQHNG